MLGPPSQLPSAAGECHGGCCPGAVLHPDDLGQPSLDAPGHVVVGRGLVGVWPELGQRADWVLNDPEDRAADGGLCWAPLLPIVSLAALLLGDRDHPDRGPWSFSNRADALLLQSKGTEMLSSNTL